MRKKETNDMNSKNVLIYTVQWQEYTELYKKDLHNQDHQNGVITYWEPDILECEVKYEQN